MVNRDKLLSELQSWVKTIDGRSLIIQFVEQHGKYNINFGEASEISVGDTLHQLDTDLLVEIRDLLRAQQPPPPLEINWQEISRRLLEERLQLTTNPMTTGEDIAYQVEQVFVPLGLVERKKVPRRKQDVFPEQGSELYREGREKERLPQDSERVEEVEVTQQFEHEEFLEQVLQQRQSPKSQGKRIAIIGEPGAGKTTILQRIAQWVSTQFPESIVIWISLADLQGDTLETYLEKRWLQRVIREAGEAEVSTTDKQHFAAQFKRGRAWLLLDGLDEMQFAGNPLSEIQRQIQEGGWLQQARLILTCRLNLWDGNRNSLAGFDTYRTLDFSYPQQVEQFIEQWFAPRRKRDLGQMLCAALKETARERIRDLVKNPLRLTLLCFSWYLKQGQLPQTQAELYQRFVDRIYEWKQEQFPTTPMQRECLNQALAELSRQAIDDAENQQQTRFRLRQDFVRRHLDGLLPGGQETLLDLALKIGWLNQVGVDADDPEQRVYAFFHPTFEEYFAALSINDGLFFLNHIPKNPMAREASYRIFEPQWRQVFLLWLGRNNDTLKPKKEALIQSLITFKDNCGGFYSDRAFLLAAVGIAEFKDCSFSDEIINQLMYWKFGSPNLLKRGWDIFVNPAKVQLREDYAALTFGSTDSQKIISALMRFLKPAFNSTIFQKVIWRLRKELKSLIPELEHIQDLDTCQDAAERLGEIDPGNEAAVRTLVHLVETNWNNIYYDTCERAAKSLGKIGIDNEIAIQALVRLIKMAQVAEIKIIQHNAAFFKPIDSIIKHLDHKLFFVKLVLQSFKTIIASFRPSKYRFGSTIRSAVESLGQIGISNEATINAIVWVIEATPDEYTRWKAINNLEKIGIGNEIAVQALVRLIKTTQDETTLWYAVKSLGNIGAGNEIAIEGLIQLMETAQGENTRSHIVESLTKISADNETAIRGLVQIIKTTQDENIRWHAAYILGKIGTGNTTAIWALVKLLEATKDENICLQASESLSMIGTGNATAIQALVKLLKATEDENILWKAAYALGKINPSNNKIAIRVLEDIVTKNRYYYTLQGAAYALTKIDPDNEIAIPTLEWLAEETPDELEFIRSIAAWNLGKIDSGNETAIRVLAEILETTKDKNIRWQAIEGLHDIDPSNEELIRTLVQVVETTEDYSATQERPYVRAVQILGNIGSGNEMVIRELVRVLDTTQKLGVRIRTIENLGKVGTGNETAIHALLRVLRTTRNKYTYKITVENLNKISIGNETTIRVLVQSLRRRNLRVYETYQLMMKCAETESYEDFHQTFKSFSYPFWISITLNMVMDSPVWAFLICAILVRIIVELVRYFYQAVS